MKTDSESVAAILCGAVEIESAEERDRFLNEVCAGDEQLRVRVDELIDNHFAAGSFLDHPAVDAVTHVAGDSGTAPHVQDISLDFLEPAQQPDSLGRMGQYEVIAAIGRGGMGIVLKAQDTNLNRIVAVKVLAPELASNATARKRFLREGQAAAAVSHDHVVTIHAVEKNEGVERNPVSSRNRVSTRLPYLVMEYIDGLSLQQKIDEQGPLEVTEILRIGRQIALGLSAAHDQGLIHRDVKPSNILLQNGVQRVQITDFGLARAVDDVGMTKTGEITGTPQYMSPEQAQGHPVDARSDLFSLGSVMYAMCTGRSPFRADTSVATLRRVCDDMPRPIREVNPDAPEWLIAVIDKLLAKDVNERFQSAEEVARLLEQYLAHLQEPSTVPEPPRPSMLRPRGWSTRGPLQRTPAVIACLLIALLSGFTVIRVFRGDGILEIRVDDPNISVWIDGDEFVITGAGPREVRLPVGEHKVQYGADGEPLRQELVTIVRDARKVLDLTWMPVEATLEPPPEPAALEDDGQLQQRLVWTQYLLSEVMSISPDGRSVAFFDFQSSDLAVHDLNTNENRRLSTASGPDGKFYTSEAVFSPDGQWLAYNWINEQHECGLHIVRIDGTESRQVLAPEEGRWIDPRGWTPDGREILCVFKRADSTQIAFVTVEDGAVREVKSLDMSLERHPFVALSPDGRYIAYEIPADDGDGQSDQRRVYVLAADGSREESVPGADDVRILGWAPGGERLLVRMNLGPGPAQAWLIRLEDGRPYGRPQHVRDGVAGDLLTAGQFTPDGAFYYVRSGSSGLDELWVVRNFLPAYQPRQTIVWSAPGLGDMISVAADKSMLAFRDADTGDLAVRDLADGTVRRLSNNAVPWESYPNSVLLSRDGQLVASEWRSERGLKSDLRVFPTGGGDPQVLYTPDGEVRRVVPQDWSPDGRQLLVRLAVGNVEERMTQIALIPLSGGPPRILRSLPYRPGFNSGSNLLFSPDGRFIAYETWSDEDSGQSDIALMSLDGEQDSVLVENDADDDILDWLPDGLLFRRWTQQPPSAWLLRIENGVPQGEPQQVLSSISGNGRFAENGTFYDVTGGGEFQDVWLATLDPESGAVLEEPKKASEQFSGHARAAAWSPDGRFLAYYVDTPGWSIVIRSADGNERVIPLPDLRGFITGMLHWSPDGNSLMLDAFARKMFVYQVNVQVNVEPGKITTVEEQGNGVHPSQLGWSKDGSEVILRRAPNAFGNGQPITQQYLRLNLESGATTPIYQQPLEQINGLLIDGDVSPDGSQLAVLHRTVDSRGGTLSLFTLPMAGGEPRVLYETSRDRSERNAGRCLSWTPDGKSLLVSLQTRRRPIGRGTPLLELCRIPADRGESDEVEPEPLGFAATGLWNLDIHPDDSDGWRIAYTRWQRMDHLRATELLEGDP